MNLDSKIFNAFLKTDKTNAEARKNEEAFIKIQKSEESFQKLHKAAEIFNKVYSVIPFDAKAAMPILGDMQETAFAITKSLRNLLEEDTPPSIGDVIMSNELKDISDFLKAFDSLLSNILKDSQK